MKNLPVSFAQLEPLSKSILKEILSLKSGYNRSKGKFNDKYKDFTMDINETARS